VAERAEQRVAFERDGPAVQIEIGADVDRSCGSAAMLARYFALSYAEPANSQESSWSR